MLLNGGNLVGAPGDADGINPLIVSGNGTGAVGGNMIGDCEVDSTLSKWEC